MFYPETLVSYQFEVKPQKIKIPLKDRIISRITNSFNMSRVKAISSIFNITSSTKILDIGCGKGAFLYLLKEKFHGHPKGLDFDKKCAAYCQKELDLDVREGDVNNHDEAIKESYDIITMWAYLEHEPDPISTLKKVRSLLSDDGLLFIEVPNEQSLENKIFGKKSFLYEVPVHMYNFSPLTLAKLVNKAGFKIEKITYPMGGGGWFGTLQRLLTGDRVYKNLRNHIPFLLFFGAMIYPLEIILGWLKLGSNIRIVVKKQLMI
jgi:2-polyprenyl-3-methyl-5-hydroxy-6-metoxy-1,4-benzoquinol methylase